MKTVAQKSVCLSLCLSVYPFVSMSSYFFLAFILYAVSFLYLPLPFSMFFILLTIVILFSPFSAFSFFIPFHRRLLSSSLSFRAPFSGPCLFPSQAALSPFILLSCPSPCPLSIFHLFIHVPYFFSIYHNTYPFL